MIRKSSRLRVKDWMNMIESTGRTIATILSLLVGVGFILGALMMTGVAYAFSHEMITLAQGNAMMLLFLGALVSFVLGMGMTISACYVFLAMTMAPPLVKMGFDPLAVHLFVMYYGMLSSITPPVALAAFAAAGISGSSPMKTGFTAMRIGIILFIVPFVFVLKPALIFHGPMTETLYLIFGFLIGIVFIVGGTEGYIYGLGMLGEGFSTLRVVSIAAGVLLVVPSRISNLIGLVLALSIVVFCLLKKHSLKQADPGQKTFN
jgi:TRAP-type uncharacterized transport system fused permease subunit